MKTALQWQELLKLVREMGQGVISGLAFLPPGKGLSRLWTPAGERLPSDCAGNIVWLRTKRKVKIPALYIKHETARFTVLYSHGNAEDLLNLCSLLHRLSKVLGVSVFAYDYPGYGASEGSPSEKGCYEAIDAAYLHLVHRLMVNPSDIILFGRSLGTGPTVDLACRTLPRAVVLQSPLASCVRVVLDSLEETPQWDMFANIDKISRIDRPILIVHGTQDSVVPFSHAQRLLEKCKQPWSPLLLIGANHNNIETEFAELFVTGLRGYLNGLHSPRFDFDAQPLLEQLPLPADWWDDREE